MIRVKLILIVMLLGVSGSYARVWSQADRMNVKTENVNLVDFFAILQQKTELRFVFNHEDAQKYSVRVDATDKTLSEVLDIALTGKPLKYEITTNHVIISRFEADVPLYQAPAKITVSGTVVGTNKMPLVGVSVTIKDTYVGTATNSGGKFSLTFTQDEGNTLVFSMIGMEKQEITIGSQRQFNVTMKEATATIEEVVVTGYYTIDKQSYTGASRTITQEELKTAGNQNILTSLRNLDPSFMLVENNNAGSNPNVLPEFQIRGQSSLVGLREEFTGNPNMPLFILDGFEVTAEKIFDLDIYRINSITILKDAAATAIYGSRAANGVVVVTSISPKPGRLYVTYNLDLTFAVADLTGYDLLNAREKLEFEKKAGMYDAHYNRPTDKQQLEDLYNERLRDIESGYDTYWLDKPLNSLSVSHKHTLRIDGGSDNFRYSLDAGYNDSKGVMKESGRRRENLGMSMQYLLGKFHFTNEMSYGSTMGMNSPYGLFSDYVNLNPYFRYKDENGHYLFMLDNDVTSGNASYRLYQMNPLWNTTLNLRDDNRYDEFKNNFNVVWDVLPGWVVRGSFAITKQHSNTVLFKPSKHTDFGMWYGDDFERRGLYRSRTGESKTLEGKLMMSYQKHFDKHVITANAVGELRENSTRWEQVQAEGFPNDKLDDLGSALQYVKEPPRSEEQPYRFAAVFGAVNYVYDNRFLMDVTARMEASSQFGSNKRWAPFWSVGIGWNLHNEEFMSGMSFFERMKLRMSYGLTGSVDYDPFQAMSTYRYMTGTRYHWGQGAGLLALGNDNLGWQKTYPFNVGLELAMFDNRLMLTADYYNKISRDVLASVTLPPSLGFPSYMANLGEIQNEGFEVNMRIVPIKDVPRNISLTLFGVAAHNTNKLRKISDALRAYNDRQDKYTSIGSSDDKDRSRPRIRYVEGASIKSIWVNPSLGIDAVTGKEVFLKPDGGTTTEWSADNYVIGGCAEPKLTGTFGFNFTYQRFMFNASFYYSMGGDIYNQTLIDRVQDADFRKNVDRRVLTDRWFEPGDISKYTAVTSTYAYTNANALTKPTSRFIERENYLELTSINVNYEINPRVLQKIGLSQLRVSFYANDLFRVSTIKQERGISYPFARNFSLSLQTRF